MNLPEQVKKHLLTLYKDISRFLLCLILFSLCLSFFVIITTGKKVTDSLDIMQKYDCILVPGCSVRGNTPSEMLKARLDTALSLYKAGAAPTLLMTGDKADAYYDEVGVMKAYALQNGAEENDILLDPAGYSTYESMYRACYVYHMENVLIVSQHYHLYRCVFDAQHLGMTATGVAAFPDSISQWLTNEGREILARDKDFLFCLFKPVPISIGVTK